MDYVGILKRAWSTTWRYKVLWLFGLFAGGAGGGSYNSGGGSGSSGSGGGLDSGSAALDKFGSQMEQFLPLLIAIGVVIVLLALIFFVLTFAAQGGLVHLVNEAEEKRAVRAGDGWGVGFRYWGRTFLIDFLIGLPMILVVIVFALVFGASIVGIVAGSAGLTGNEAAAGAAGLAGGIGGACCGMAFLIIAAFAYSIVFGTVAQLALRYAVLEDRPAIASLKQGWADVWAKRGAVGMYFMVWLTGILYSIVVGVLLAVFIVPIVFLAIAGNIAGVAGLGMLAALVSMFPGAIYGTFVSAAWTIFFRKMTGREQAVGSVMVGLPPETASAFPPPPPSAIAEQAPYDPFAPVAAQEPSALEPPPTPEPSAAWEPPAPLEAEPVASAVPDPPVADPGDTDGA
jgi:hypothetical protein